jgi:hypothetical protein
MSSDDKSDDKELVVSGTSTIDNALKLVDTQATDFNSYRIKELGLTLTLLGMAELQAKRIQKLSSLVFNLEQEVFSTENIRELEPAKLLNLYKLGTDALKESSQYIKDTIKSVDWNSVEAQLIQAATNGDKEVTNSVGSDNISSVINELLSKIKTPLNSVN